MTTTTSHTERHGRDTIADYPLLAALHNRRSRRFGRGMAIAHGPLAYTSDQPPLPLTEEEEALLAFSACRITGAALGELEYARGRGGGMLAGWTSRTTASADAVQNVALIVSNDEATYLIRRPQDMSPVEVAEAVDLAERGEYVEAYRHCRVRIQDSMDRPHSALRRRTIGCTIRPAIGSNEEA